MTLSLGAIFAFFGVALGAFGAHALKEIFDEYSMGLWQTAVNYQFVHALALVMIGFYERSSKFSLVWPRRFFSVGIFLFSGSLYLLAFTGNKWLGAITPLGGLSFLLGWLFLAIFSWKNRN
jgi:uncharacterized membrane protein YgdD (TMEM256/DUF423 family)